MPSTSFTKKKSCLHLGIFEENHTPYSVKQSAKRTYLAFHVCLSGIKIHMKRDSVHLQVSVSNPFKAHDYD